METYKDAMIASHRNLFMNDNNPTVMNATANSDIVITSNTLKPLEYIESRLSWFRLSVLMSRNHVDEEILSAIMH